MILVAGDFENSGAATAWELLRAGKSALEAIEQGIRLVEANVKDQSVGRGGLPNALGEVELDAGVMDGRTRASGAVGALRGYAHPVSIAYRVMTDLPHVLLVGDGAARFAEEIGAERAANLLTEDSRQKWLEWCRQMNFDPEGDHDQLADLVFRGRDPQRSGGTTVYLAQDGAGDIAAATSTSGWAWKYPGRLGDSPVAGAGFYADNRYGAAACTGRGEIAIRSGLARITVAYMQMGRTPEEAVREAMADIRFHGDQTTGITTYAINHSGQHYVGHLYEIEPMHPYYYAAIGDEALPTKRDSNDLSAVI